MEDLESTGWTVGNKPHDWAVASEKITDYIQSLNYGYRKVLNNEKVTYFNKLAKFVGPNQVELVDAEGKSETIWADKILIATGGRPNYPDIPGAIEHSITSDDIFWMK